MYTVRTRKQWNKKTTLYQNISVLDVVTKQICLLDTNLITCLVEWACQHCKIVVSHVHWPILKS